MKKEVLIKIDITNTPLLNRLKEEMEMEEWAD
jgi:hypothetical protein